MVDRLRIHGHRIETSDYSLSARQISLHAALMVQTKKPPGERAVFHAAGDRSGRDQPTAT
jgi:hypothetical protein